MAKRQILAVPTPIGHHVVLTRDRWREIIRYKHPALAGHESEVEDCLRDPDLVRTSAKDTETHLYYRARHEGVLCVVVGGDDPRQRFVITAYFTDGIKKGQDLWKK